MTKTTHSLSRGAALLAVLAALVAALLITPGSVQAKSVVWNNYDVTLTLNQDGSYHVAERQTIDFIGGSFSGGTATIPLTRIDGITNVKVSEIASGATTPYSYVAWSRFTERPQTYSWTTTGTQVEIDWGFGSVYSEVRTFLLEYDVQGALRVYTNPPNEQIWWTAIGTDVTDVAPVEHATMTIVLPQAVSLTDPALMLAGPGGTAPSAHTTDGKTWTWTTGNLKSGDSFEVRLQIPPIVNASPPHWQAADDAQRKAQETADEHKAALNVIFLGVGLGLAALGGIGLYALWYTRGRDPHVGLVAEFVAAPPDDLPAGAVGVLTDERVDSRDMVASVVDLARRGVIKLDQGTTDPLGAAHDYTLTLVQPDAQLAPFEKTLLSALFSGKLTANQTVKLSQVSRQFTSVSGQIERQLYQEVVDRGYFNASPEATRERWKHASNVLLGLVLIGGVVALAVVGFDVVFLWFAIIVAAVLALCLRWLSRSLPRRTDKGAEEAAKWLAFRRYLGDIPKYEKVAESREIFEKYLAYAIAFGLDEAYVSSFLAVGTPLPDWFSTMGGGPVVIGNFGGYGPYGRRRGGWYGGPGGGWIVGGPGPGGPSQGGGGGGVDIPSLQEASDQAGRGVQSASDSFFDMLDKAAKAFGSGGGRGGGWGGGGFGGGFGGGGSHGGSSGGGGRGFH